MGRAVARTLWIAGSCVLGVMLGDRVVPTAHADAREPLLSEFRSHLHVQVSEALKPWKGGQVAYRHLHGAGFTTTTEAGADARGDSLGAIAGVCLRREFGHRLILLGSAHLGLGHPLYPRNRIYGEVGLRPLGALTLSTGLGRHGYRTGDDRHTTLTAALSGGGTTLSYRWLRYHDPGHRPVRSAHVVTAGAPVSRSSSFTLGYMDGLLTRFEGVRPVGLPVAAERTVSVGYHHWVTPYEGFFITAEWCRQRCGHERQGIGGGYVLVIL